MTTSAVSLIEREYPGFERLPKEVEDFFAETSGQSLLVTGAPGTGKTLFTLRVLDSLARGPDEALYVSSRIDEDAIHRLYLDEYPSLDRTNILDLSRGPFDTPLNVDFPFDDLSRDTFLDWVRTVSDVSHGFALAFDSWKLIQESLGPPAQERGEDEGLVDRLAALARQEGIDLVLVAESKSASALEYISDGVVRLLVKENDAGQTLRTLLLEKLRGVHIGDRSKPSTLSGGKYRSCSPVRIEEIRAGPDAGQWVPTSGTRSTFATGIETLDDLLTNGYNRGSLVHVELGPDLPRDAWTLVVIPTIRNFLAKERGVAVVPPRESSPGLLHSDLSAAVSPDVFEEKCTVFEPSMDVSSIEDEPNEEIGWPVYQTKLEGGKTNLHKRDPKIRHEVGDTRGITIQTFLQEIEKIRPSDDGPVLHVLDTEAMENRIKSRLGDLARYIALHNDLALFITKPGSELQTGIDRVADVHLRLERQEGTIMLSGRNPVTPLLSVGVDTEKSVPRVVLVEMV